MNELMLTSIKKEELSELIEQSVRKVLLETPVNPSDENESDFLTIEQAAIFVNLAKATIYALCSMGKIPVLKKGKRLYFVKTELTEWLRSGRKKTNDEIELEAINYVNGKRIK